MSNSILSASAKGATLLILLQVSSRALTFAINQVLLRFLSPELLGLSVQLELYSISVLYFARESLRVALQRQSHGVQTVVNLSYLAVGLGVPLSGVLAWAWMRAGTPDVPYFGEALGVYALATVVELATEPAFVAVQQMMRYRIRASAETAATIARCLFTAASVVWASKNGRAVGVLPFAVGQMAYAVVLFSVNLVQLWPIASKDRFSLLPKRIASNDRTQYIFSYFSRPLCSLGASLFLQSSIKYVLTQGDSLLITSLASLRDQGAYALAAKYGGLVARMLFQPIEESSRTLFAKLCASPLPSDVSHSSSSSSSSSSAADDTKKAATAAPDSQPITQPTTTPPSADSDSLRQASSILLDILKFYFLLGTVAITAGPSLASPLLTLVAGSRWTSTGAGAVLASYSFYIPLLALNGVSEAFVAAVASTQQLHGQSAVMGAFFGAFAGVAYLCVGVLGWGARGLVVANCANLGLRSAWNVVFVRRYFVRKQVAFELSSALPTPWTVAAATMVPATMHFTDGLLARYGVVGELVQKGGVAALFVLVLAYLEHEYLVHCYRMLRPAQDLGRKGK